MILPNSQLCRLECTIQGLVLGVCSCALCPATPPLSHLSCYLPKSVAHAASLPILGYIYIESWGPWLAAALECLRALGSSVPSPDSFPPTPCSACSSLHHTLPVLVSPPKWAFQSHPQPLAESHWPGPPTLPARPARHGLPMGDDITSPPPPPTPPYEAGL